MPCQHGCWIVSPMSIDAESYASPTGDRNVQPVAHFHLERNREPSRPLELPAIRTWITKQLRTLDQWDTPEPDQQLFEDCGAMIREAARRAAKAGLFDHYERHKRARHSTPAHAKAILQSILSATEPEPEFLTPPQVAKVMGVNPDKVRAWIRAGTLRATDVSEGTRPRYRVARTDVERFLEGRRKVTPPASRRKPRKTPLRYF